MIYHVAIATVIFFSFNGKITCHFHVLRHHVCARQLTWYFIGGYIINDYITKKKIMVVADRLSEIVKMQVKPFEDQYYYQRNT